MGVGWISMESLVQHFEIKSSPDSNGNLRHTVHLNSFESWMIPLTICKNGRVSIPRSFCTSSSSIEVVDVIRSGAGQEGTSRRIDRGSS